MTEIEELEKKLDELEKEDFYLEMEDHWNADDFRHSRELNRQIIDIKKQLKELRGE